MSTCERCASTGIARASLVKDDKFNNDHIAVVLCSEYSETTDTNLALLAATGIEVKIVGKASEERQQSSTEEQS